MATKAQRAFQLSVESLQPDIQPDHVAALRDNRPASLPFDNSLNDIDAAFSAMASMEAIIDALKDSALDPKDTAQMAMFSVALHRSQQPALVEPAMLPSMETYEHFNATATQVTMESLRESVRKTLAAIIRALVQFWERLSDFVSDLTRSTAVVRTRVALTRTYVRDITGAHARVESIDVTKMVSGLGTERIPAIDHRRILENLSNLREQISTVRRQYLPMIIRLANDYSSVYNEWNRSDTDANAWLGKLNDIGSRYSPTAALAMQEAFTNTASTIVKAGTKMSRPMPGGKSIVAVEVASTDLDAAGSNEVKRAAAYQSASALLVELRPDFERPREEVEMDVMTPSQLESILNAVLKVADEIDMTVRDDTRRAVRELSRRLEGLSRSSTEVSDGQTAQFQAGLGYARTLARWSKEPYFSLLGHSASVCNNAVAMVQMHTRAYLPEPKNPLTPKQEQG